MLQIIVSMKDLSFSRLMHLYRQENETIAALHYPQLPYHQGLLETEQELYQFYKEFLKQKNAFLALWIEDHTYCSAVRVEPYRDGVLLEALETDSDFRGRGYAAQLLNATNRYIWETFGLPVYSHIRKDNKASIAVHMKCSFRKVLDEASYIDGSVLPDASTYIWP